MWVSENTERVNIDELGRPADAVKIYASNMAFLDKEDGTYKRHKTRTHPNSYVIQASSACVEVFPTYATYYDVHYENIAIEEERWVVQRLFREPDTWRDIDAYNPRLSLLDTEDDVVITVEYDTDYGPLKIEYVKTESGHIKHNIYFINDGEANKFRVIQEWAGIVADKVNNSTPTKDTEKDDIAFIFTQNDKVVVKEILWGARFESYWVQTREDDDPWVDPNEGTYKDGESLGVRLKTEGYLTPAIIGVHPKGLKASYTYGVWELGTGQQLYFDPDTTTIQPPSEDAHVSGYTRDANYNLNYLEINGRNIYQLRLLCQWDITELDGATVSDATVYFYQYAANISSRASTYYRTTSTFDESTVTDETRPSVTSGISWTVTGSLGWKSKSITAHIQAAVAADEGFYGCFYKNDNEGNSSSKYVKFYSEEYGSLTPYLYVTFTPGIAIPTVTTQAATGLTVGAGTLHGTITATGGENADERGFDWDYDSGTPYAYEETDEGDYGTGAFEEIMSGFTEGNTVYFRGKANNSAGWGYGGEESFVVRKAITRSASASIGLVGTTGRGFIGTRTAVAAFSLVGTTGRTLEAFRAASAALGITGATDRILHAVRSAGATMSIVGIAARSWIGRRAASAAMAIAGTSERLLHSLRAASASMSVVGTAARSWVGTRSAVASVSLVGTAARSWIGSRSASAAMAIAGTPARLLHSLRAASASISQTAAATRAVVVTRTASATLAVQGTAGRMLGAFRAAAASMSATGTATRSWIGTRAASAAIGAAAVAKAVRVVTRTASASMGIVGTAGRSWIGSRSASASLSAVATSTRALIMKRTASASMGIIAISGRILEAIRSAAASMSMVGITSRTFHAIRSAGAAISAVGTAGRSWIGTRAASASMAVTGATSRILHSIRSASASLSQVATATRSGVFTRAASASMAVTGTADRIYGAIRSASAALGVTAVAGAFRNVIRTASASMGLTAVGERAVVMVRSASASMGIIGVGGFFRRVIRGLLRTTLGGRLSSLGFGGRTVILKEGEKEVKGEVSKKDG